MVIIGIIGPKNSGKDTIADYLCLQHDFHKEAFAAPVKDICEKMFLLDKAQLTDHELKEKVDERWGLTPRQMYQQVGTDIARNHFGDGFWVKHLNLRIKESSYNKIVISDVRFKNEAKWVKDNSGILVRVIDPSLVSSDTHSSETEQESITEDILILNDKNLGVNSLFMTIEKLVIPIIN